MQEHINRCKYRYLIESRNSRRTISMAHRDTLIAYRPSTCNIVVVGISKWQL